MSSYVKDFWNILSLNLKTFTQYKTLALSLFLLSALLSVLAGAAGSFFLTGAGRAEVVSVAIVDLDDSFETRMIISAVTENEDYGELLTFSFHSPQSAAAALSDGSAAAVITLPEGFGHGIITGANIPFSVSYNQNMPLSSSLVRLSAEAFSTMLRISQTGVYVTLNYAALQELTQESYDMIFMGVNLRFLGLVLGRGEIFVHETLSVTGGLLIWQSYLLAAYTALMLCAAYVMTDALRRNYSRFFLLSFKSRGMPLYIVFAACIFAYFLFFLALNAALWLLSAVVASVFLLPAFALNSGLIAAVAAVSLVIAAFAAMLTFAFNSSLSAGAFTAVFACVSLFLSGGILPTLFFSEGLALAASAVWSTWGVRLLSAAVLEDGLAWPLIMNLIFFMVFAGIGAGFAELKGRAL